VIFPYRGEGTKTRGGEKERTKIFVSMGGRKKTKKGSRKGGGDRPQEVERVWLSIVPTEGVDFLTGKRGNGKEQEGGETMRGPSTKTTR